jgi:hypothetical protein
LLTIPAVLGTFTVVNFERERCPASFQLCSSKCIQPCLQDVYLSSASPSSASWHYIAYSALCALLRCMLYVCRMLYAPRYSSCQSAATNTRSQHHNTQLRFPKQSNLCHTNDKRDSCVPGQARLRQLCTH